MNEKNDPAAAARDGMCKTCNGTRRVPLHGEGDFYYISHGHKRAIDPRRPTGPLGEYLEFTIPCPDCPEPPAAAQGEGDSETAFDLIQKLIGAAAEIPGNCERQDQCNEDNCEVYDICTTYQRLDAHQWYSYFQKHCCQMCGHEHADCDCGNPPAPAQGEEHVPCPYQSDCLRQLAVGELRGENCPPGAVKIEGGDCTVPAPTAPSPLLAVVFGDWARGRWDEEVANRPKNNVHHRTLDQTWKQVIRYADSLDRRRCVEGVVQRWGDKKGQCSVAIDCAPGSIEDGTHVTVVVPEKP